MSLESELTSALLAKCPRTFPVVATFGTPLPYVVWQHAGGRTTRYADNTAAGKRNALIQVTVWAGTPMAAMALLRSIEDALCAHADLQVDPQGEPVNAYDDGDELSGYLQTFSIWGER
ncbi:DUF3168 domain-containing protein [Variovorax sp. H27-G14]|uniref:tail completion protein gp17 n=1 Tax=Variovorax sp. H27-G14 TaxID=3111914 RepID=UPI0038FC930B